MHFLPKLKPRLPNGYSINVWKDAAGNDKYSVFRGDDRLMTFSTKAEAYAYANQFHQQHNP